MSQRTDIATRYGVDPRTVHRWLVRYASDGLGALVDKSPKPDRCVDPFGHTWTIGTHVEDVGPEEMMRRMAEMQQ